MDPEVQAVIDAQEPTEQVTPVNADSGNSGGHPAWAGLLGAIPADLQPLVTPHLDEFDKGVQDRFSKLNEKYDPWKDVIDNSNPEDAQRSIAIAQQLNADPKAVWEALGEAFGYGSVAPTETAPPVPVTPPVSFDSLDETDPMVQLMKQQQATLDKINAAEEARTQSANEAMWQQRLNSTIDTLAEKHGEFDRDYVIALIANGADPEQAVVQFKASIAKYGAPAVEATPIKEEAPPVAGSGGGLPAEGIDVTKLDNKGLNDLVTQMLEAGKTN